MQRILVVDDHADSREIMERVLSREGYAVEVVGTAAEARRICGAGWIDLLIAEVALPDGDGWSLMRDLVRECGQRGLAVSAHARAVDEQRSLDAGFSAHITKPISVAQLTEAVRSALAPAPQSPERLPVPVEQIERPVIDPVERRKRAMELLQEAERALVLEAANLTAAGVNTSGLAGPMISMQEALAELQALEVEANCVRGLVDPVN
jgi:CheY-like chemotaxis protein